MMDRLPGRFTSGWLPVLMASAMVVVLNVGCVTRQGSASPGIYQRSTIGALLSGDYDSDMTVGDLLGHGDFGIGTFDGLDGEMVVLDGVCRRIGADGRVSLVGSEQLTSFAAVLFFSPDRQCRLDGGGSFESVKKQLDATLPSRNYFYAVRLKGRFTVLKARSVPRQNKPYPPLAEVVKSQPVFSLKDVEGTLVGFRSPDFVGTMGVPGYHFHFLSADGAAGGGHLLDCVLASPATAEIQEVREFHLSLPQTAGFKQSDLNKGTEQDLKKAEK